MTTGKEYRIVTIADIANLSPDQRARCIVDFTQWLKFRDAMQPLIADGAMDQITEMIWVDDDRTGEVSEIRFTDRETGQILFKKDM